jgi:hypothetical protein
VADVVRERARETAEQASSVVEYAEAFRALRLG